MIKLQHFVIIMSFTALYLLFGSKTATLHIHVISLVLSFKKMIPQSIRQWDKWLKTEMSSNSLGCKSSLSSNLIFKKHHDSRLLFHISISFVKPPYNHKLTRSQNVRRILMLLTPVTVDRGLSDVTFFQFKYFLVKKLREQCFLILNHNFVWSIWSASVI